MSFDFVQIFFVEKQAVSGISPISLPHGRGALHQRPGLGKTLYGNLGALLVGVLRS
jgi:hypothetical protein